MKKNHLLLFSALISQFLFSQTGVVDTSFGTNGVVKAYSQYITNNTGDYQTKKIAFDTNGSIVSFKNNLFNNKIQIIESTHIDAEGISVWNKASVVNDGLLDANSNIFAIGFTSKDDDNKAMCLIKLKKVVTGSSFQWILDNTFNFDGKTVFDTKESNEEAIVIKLQSDGKIVIAGFSGSKATIVRFDSTGYLDRTFNQTGYYSFQIGQNCKPTSLEIQSDNKIIVAGNSFNGSNTDFFVTRINNNGSIDANFGTNGLIVKDVNNYDNTGNTMILAADGSIFIGGKSYTLGGGLALETQYSYNFSVFKFDSNGQSVTSYSNGYYPGAAIFSSYHYLGSNNWVPQNDDINYMILDNGTIRAFGHSTAYLSPNKNYCAGVNISPISNSNSLSLINFGQTNYSFNSSSIFGVVKPSDNSLYSVINYDNCSNGQNTLIKTPTNAFPTTCNDNANSMAYKTILKITSGYYALDYSNRLFKLDINFNIDYSFGTNGKLNNVVRFKVDSNDKIICNLNLGDASGNKVLLARYNSNGNIDTTFGFYGTLTTTKLISVNNITVTPQNDYIVTTTSFLSGLTYVTIEKIKNSGEKDTSFGSNNGETTLYTTQTASSIIDLRSTEDVFVDSNGNYYTVVYYNSQFIKLYKVLPNGQLDATFGTNGFVDVTTSSIQPVPLNFIRTDSGKFLLYTYKRLVQLNSNGSIDTNFGTNGEFLTDAISTFFLNYKVLSKGSDYFIGGWRTTGGDNSTIVKINSLGIIDATFATNGSYLDTDATTQNISYGMKNMYFDGLNSIVFYGGSNVIKRVN